MTKLIVKRIALGLLTLWFVSLIIFVITQLLPGDAAQAILGKQATPHRLAVLRAELHLNESAFAQYWHWISGVVHGDFGESYSSRTSVSSLISTRIGNTLFLVGVAAAVAIPLAIGLGVISAVYKDRLIDHSISVFTLVAAAVPEFVIGIIFILLFATTVFAVLPSVSLLAPGEFAWENIEVVILPALTILVAVVPYVSRMMRACMVDVLASPYIETARLKGVSPRRLTWRHAAPNAAAPTIQVIALMIGYMVGGIVLVEFVFSYPGLGTTLVSAVSNRDIPLIQAISLLIAGVYVVANLVADLITIVLSPRVRTGMS